MIHEASCWNQRKNKQARALIAVLVLACWCIVFYGSFIESQSLVVEESEVIISEQITDSIKAVLIGDIHAGPYRKSQWVQKVVDAANLQEPDIIFLLGDYVYDDADQTKYLSALSGLNAPLGVFAVTGNHDHRTGNPEQIRASLESYGITLLDNAHYDLFADESLWLVGISDVWYDADLQTAFEGITTDDTAIFLSHNPEVSLYAATHKADLVLSGHTHGGQVRLPFLGSVSEIPSLLGRKYDKGLFSYNTWQLYITPGVGETGPRARLFNPPQIDVVTVFY